MFSLFHHHPYYRTGEQVTSWLGTPLTILVVAGVVNIAAPGLFVSRCSQPAQFAPDGWIKDESLLQSYISDWRIGNLWNIRHRKDLECVSSSHICFLWCIPGCFANLHLHREAKKLTLVNLWPLLYKKIQCMMGFSELVWQSGIFIGRILLNNFH